VQNVQANLATLVSAAGTLLVFRSFWVLGLCWGWVRGCCGGV